MTSSDSKTSRRAIYISLAVVVFVLGVISRRVEIGNQFWDKYLGDALYAILFYLCLGILWPQQPILFRALATSIFVVCIECFQITGIPAQMRKNGNTIMKLVSVVLGTKFGWGDMLAYFIGLAGILGFDRLYVSRAERTSDPTPPN